MERNLRRMRDNNKRSFFSEINASLNDICHPVFLKEGITDSQEIPAMPGVYSHDIYNAMRDVAEARQLGIKHFVLRPVPTHESRDNPAQSIDFEQRVISEIRNEFRDITILVDGYFGQTRSNGDYGPVCLDKAAEQEKCLQEIAAHAVAQADAGADFVISLGRVDNSVLAIRRALDQANHNSAGILAYSINFASTLAHAMMRDPKVVDRAHEQTIISKIPISNIGEAIAQAKIEMTQGADIIGVKPATIFCDAITRLKAETNHPIATYIVSKEYSMVKAAAERGWVDEKATAIEYFISLKRAGANRIFSYWAKDYAKWIAAGEM